jgi:hypothetical protein
MEAAHHPFSADGLVILHDRFGDTGGLEKPPGIEAFEEGTSFICMESGLEQDEPFQQIG